LAPISAVPQSDLPAVIQRMRHRLGAEADRTAVAELWTATAVLLGLRYEAEFVERLLQGVRAMKESTTYQAIQKEGRFQEVREDIRLLGEGKFKSPLPTHVQTTLDNILDLEQLKLLLRRILDVSSWDELVASPPRQAPSPPKK
jgi:hypothetical protein